MLQIIILGLLIFLTLMAALELIRSCVVGEDKASRKTLRLWAAPVGLLKNKLKGMKTLKEESAQAPDPSATGAKSETV